MTPPTPLRVLIADDERPARMRLEDLIGARPDTHLVQCCTGGAEAVAAIHRLRPDVALLDVQMPEVSGLDVVRAVGPEAMPVTIFVTAYDRYALEAFEVSAVDYLLKPYSDERFEQAFERAAQFVRGGQWSDTLGRLGQLLAQTPAGAVLAASEEPETGPLRRFVLKGNSRVRLLDADRVGWIEGAGSYVVLHAEGQRHLYRGLVGRVAERLDPQKFVRVHKSAIVNLDNVRELLPDSHGEFTIVLLDGTQLKLSRTYRANVEARLGQPL